ncbi:MAG: VacB/RNase II family 3'-5' exoribonuclease [Defluviitaleaceae bacterium]|nr:VacB/RNase II family 3'-5' exoribonuclease [Defluviitaleaceae bacterium]MCL2836369.1 VacB/RNase II family 3'-5' exoribonuclease [Defluviitaleaceae bacterium]
MKKVKAKNPKKTDANNIKPDGEIRSGVFARELGRYIVRLSGGRQSTVYIREDKTLGAQPGQAVLVRMPNQGKSRKLYNGEVLRIIGNERDPGVDIQSIVIAQGMPFEFTPDALDEAAQTPVNVILDDITGRVDYRLQYAITMDGADAKDLDDAVYLENNDGRWKLYVHIADVAHYVHFGGAMDKNAYTRGTSAYLADRVIPMLPVELSNGICSLNAGEDRLAVSCVMEIGADGAVLGSEICESVINVKERMTYGAVLDILESGEGLPMLFEMKKLAGVLKENRKTRGAIELVSSECRFTLDDSGHPIDVARASATVATSIIEEFMIICNETVARTMRKNQMPLLYRVHDSSSPDKLDKLYNLAHVLGLRKRKFSTTKNAKKHKKGQKPKTDSVLYSSKAVQALIKLANGTQYEEIINRAALGCMQQAVYSARNTGHYGLASQCYCHFTAPIRRYPDLFCHRMVKAYLRGGFDKDEKTQIKQGLAETARHLSAMERRAVEAEREVENLKKAQYMADKLGQVFTGRITGIQRWGMYVELPNTVEGLVGYRHMNDDFYIVDEENYRVYGQRTRKTFRLGDNVRVCVVEADIERRNLDMVIVDKNMKI